MTIPSENFPAEWWKLPCFKQRVKRGTERHRTQTTQVLLPWRHHKLLKNFPWWISKTNTLGWFFLHEPFCTWFISLSLPNVAFLNVGWLLLIPFFCSLPCSSDNSCLFGFFYQPGTKTKCECAFSDSDDFFFQNCVPTDLQSFRVPLQTCLLLVSHLLVEVAF